MVGFRLLTNVTRLNVVCDKFSHALEVEKTLDHAKGLVYHPVARNNGVVVGHDDFLDSVLRYDDFIVWRT